MNDFFYISVADRLFQMKIILLRTFRSVKYSIIVTQNPQKPISENCHSNSSQEFIANIMIAVIAISHNNRIDIRTAISFLKDIALSV